MAIPSLALSNERSLAIPFHSLVVSSGGNPSQLPSSVLTFKEVRESHHHKAQGVRRSVEGVERESASSCFGRPHSRTRNQGEPEEEEEASWSLLASFSTSLALSFSLSLSVASAEPNHPPTAPQEGGRTDTHRSRGTPTLAEGPRDGGMAAPTRAPTGPSGSPARGAAPESRPVLTKPGETRTPGREGAITRPAPAEVGPGPPSGCGVRRRRPPRGLPVRRHSSLSASGLASSARTPRRPLRRHGPGTHGLPPSAAPTSTEQEERGPLQRRRQPTSPLPPPPRPVGPPDSPGPARRPDGRTDGLPPASTASASPRLARRTSSPPGGGPFPCGPARTRRRRRRTGERRPRPGALSKGGRHGARTNTLASRRLAAAASTSHFHFPFGFFGN